MYLQLFKYAFKLILRILPLILLFIVIYIGYVIVTEGSFPPQSKGSQANTATNTAILDAIKQVNKQVFIEHYMTLDVQYTEAPTGWVSLLGLKQEMIVLVRGRVPAGFDLEQLSKEDIWVSGNGKKAQLVLPPPTIFADNVSIDFENSRVLAVSDTCPDFLCSQSTLEAYNNEVMPEATDKLIATAHENGILNQAARDGKAYYEQLLKSLGFEEVRIIIPGYN